MIENSDQGISIDANLRLERFHERESVQVIEVRTMEDSSLVVCSQGALPKVSFAQLRKAKAALAAICNSSGQNVIVEHNGNVVSQATALSNAQPLISINWWTVFKQIVFSRNS